jgi:hypothetical protein
MAGEIQLNSTTMATESSGSITLSNVDSATNRTNLGLGSMATQNANAVALTGGSITGTTLVPTTPFSFRNRIINGNLSNPINQRGAASITTPSSGSTGYTYDRWYYDGSTATPYLYQGIEDKNVNNGTYVISWVGAGINAAWKVSTDTTANNGPDATTGFTSVSNGGTFTVNEGTEYSKHLWIRFDGTLANLDKVMVEEGTVATPFEHRPISVELSLCQRYYFQNENQYMYFSARNLDNSVAATIPFPVEMRATPSITKVSDPSGVTFTWNRVCKTCVSGGGTAPSNAYSDTCGVIEASGEL